MTGIERLRELVNGYVSLSRVLSDIADQIEREQGSRVKLPAPKVLDADGVEICVGDTVWFKYDLNINNKYTVINIENNCPLPIICIDEDGVESGFYSSGLSHKRPDSWERLAERERGE